MIAAADRAATNTVRILLVEDNPGDTDLVLDYVSESERTVFDVHDVPRLDRALSVLSHQEFDVILLDLGLPDAHGMEALEAIRRQVPNIPIVVLTGLSQEHNAIRALEKGAQDYLLKSELNAALLVHSTRYAMERHNLEEKLRHAQRMEAIGRLAGGVAHDFNNLLTGILGFSDLALQNLETGDPLRRDLQEIVNAAERAQSLTRQLLAFGRKQMLRPRALDLNAVLTGMEALLRRVIGEDVELLMNLATEPMTVKFDPGHIEQIVMNLAVNARHAMPDGGRLTISTRDIDLPKERSGGDGDQPGVAHVLLSVSDTGVGMDLQTRSRIFEPYFTTKEHGEGTGLGLSTVYGLVEQSGGDISVDSEPGNGTTFDVYLPRTTEHVVPVEAEHAVAPITQGTETILVVEDEAMVRRLIVRVLEQAGYTVLACAGVDEATEICQRGDVTIDLLITDVILPKKNGPEVAKMLTDMMPGLKVVYISGYTAAAVANHGAIEPMAPFLEKPIAPRVLLEGVRKVLGT